jgi:putative mRNA 3-end processing factor
VETFGLHNFLEFTHRGLYCAAGGFYLDSKRTVKHSVISHAHSDHAIRGNENVYCTAPTAAFMEKKFRGKGEYHIKNYGENFSIGGVSITLFPAGHILGSAQVLMEFDGVKYLYTGDFKTAHDPSCEPFHFVKADVLYTETTFAKPSFSHPDPAQEIQKLNQYKGINILIGCYSLGKAQRITQLATQYCPEKQVIVHSESVAFHKIYESFGFSLGNWSRYNRRLLKENDNIIYVVPPTVYYRHAESKAFLKTFATGWKQFYRNNDLRLTISDHADWRELHELIAYVKPKTVFTLHGDGSRLKKFFEGQAMNVVMLTGKRKEESKPQTLSLFSDENIVR